MCYRIKRKGLTLMEMGLCALAVVLFAAVVSYGSSHVITAGKVAAANTQVASIASAISRYKYEIGSYPVNLQALTVSNGIYGPWLSGLPSTDPFGTSSTGINGSSGGSSAYCYSASATRFAVWSFGANKVNNSGGSGTTVPSSIATGDVGVISQ